MVKGERGKGAYVCMRSMRYGGSDGNSDGKMTGVQCLCAYICVCVYIFRYLRAREKPKKGQVIYIYIRAHGERNVHN